MRRWLCLLALGLLAASAPAQESRYVSWGGFNGFSGGWSRRGVFAESGQVWDSGPFDLGVSRTRSVRYAGGGLEASAGRGATFASLGGGVYLLESSARDFDRFGFLRTGYTLTLGVGARASAGVSLGGGASLIGSATWLPRPRGEKLPARPALSVGLGWRY